MICHALERSSPVGDPFVGTCIQCGKTGLTMDDFFKDSCENHRGLSEEEALLEAIEGVNYD